MEWSQMNAGPSNCFGVSQEGAMSCTVQKHKIPIHECPSLEKYFTIVCHRWFVCVGSDDNFSQSTSKRNIHDRIPHHRTFHHVPLDNIITDAIQTACIDILA